MRKLLATSLLIFASIVWAQQALSLVYGPVEPGDNLWHVAEQFSEHYDLTPEQAIGMLFENNIRAFVGGDPNNLMAGTYLVLPENTPRRMPTTIEHVEPEIAAEIGELIADLNVPTIEAQKEDLSLHETVAELVFEPELELPEVNEGTQLASLELLAPATKLTAPLNDAMDVLLGVDETAFVKFLDGIKSDLSIAQEAIETERRSKDLLQSQLQDLQIQINALTELVALKDQEISSMLQPHVQRLNEAASRSTSGLAAGLPTELLILLQQAGENQMVLLLIAVVIASMTMYFWDLFARKRVAPAALEQPTPDVVLQSLQDIDTQIALGNYEQATSHLEKMLSLYPQNFNVLYKLCQVYVKDNQQATYRQRLEKISKQWQQKHPKRWSQLSDLYELAWPMCFEGADNSDGTYEGDPPSDPIQTKLDLARAYLDIGDHENAALILQEVLTEGNDQQSTTAQMLLDNIKQ